MTSLIVLARVLVAVGQALQNADPGKLEPAREAKARKATPRKATQQAIHQATHQAAPPSPRGHELGGPGGALPGR